MPAELRVTSCYPEWTSSNIQASLLSASGSNIPARSDLSILSIPIFYATVITSVLYRAMFKAGVQRLVRVSEQSEQNALSNRL